MSTSSGTLGAVAVVVTSAVVLGTGIASRPDPPLPQPIVVDADPGLPSDEEPPEGWPSPPVDGGPLADTTGPAATTDEPSDLVDDLTGTIGDTTDTTDTTDTADTTALLTGPLRDAVDGITDAVEDTTGAVEDTADEVTDTVDELVDDAAGTTADAAGTTADAADAADAVGAVDTAPDPLDDLP